MLLFYLFIISIVTSKETKQNDDNQNKPNIIVIVMDDLGFNDVPWHYHSNTQMPFLEKFVNENALKIDTFYAMPLCSITRSALLTGRYPMRYGLQSSVVENLYPFGLSIFEKIITGDFKAAGYNTYAIGKWHLGFHRQDLTPLHRGFDEFRGSLSPMIHYFNYAYSVQNNGKQYTGYDLWINSEKVSMEDTNKRYLTDWEGDQFVDILNEIVENDVDGKQPFFMYVAMHASHDPREATNECLGLYYTTDCIDRGFEQFMNCQQHQIMQAQSSCADQTLQRMITHLQNIHNGKIWQNTLLIWLSDNGAPPWDGDNSPLRGAKKELYEGGVRTPAFVSGGYLNVERYGKTFDEHTPFHVVDLYPTLLSAAGIEHKRGKILDGLDQWNAIQNGIISKEADGSQREFLYNVDAVDCMTAMCGAYRYGHYKFIWTQNTAPDQQYWYDYYSINPRRHDDGSMNKEYTNYLQCNNIPDDVKSMNEYNENGVLIGSLPCVDRPCIFNIMKDPCEYNDLSRDRKYENLYLFMYNMLFAYYETQQISLRAYYDDDKFDENGDPALHDGYWESWLRDYNQNDDIRDFEDVMGDNYDYDESQDVTVSEYYLIAMKYKQKWDKEIINGLLEDEETMIEIEEDVEYNGFKHFRLLMFITVVLGIIIIIGFIILIVRWWRTCCQIRRHQRYQRNDDLSLLNDDKYIQTVAVEQMIYATNQRRPTTPCNNTLKLEYDNIESINVNDIVESIIDNEHMPLLKQST